MIQEANAIEEMDEIAKSPIPVPNNIKIGILESQKSEEVESCAEEDNEDDYDDEEETYENEEFKVQDENKDKNQVWNKWLHYKLIMRTTIYKTNKLQAFH